MVGKDVPQCARCSPKSPDSEEKNKAISKIDYNKREDVSTQLQMRVKYIDEKFQSGYICSKASVGRELPELHLSSKGQRCCRAFVSHDQA